MSTLIKVNNNKIEADCIINEGEIFSPFSATLIVDSRGRIMYSVIRPDLGYGRPFIAHQNEGWCGISYNHYSHPDYYRYPKGAASVAHLQPAVDVFISHNEGFNLRVPVGCFGVGVNINGIASLVDVLTEGRIIYSDSVEQLDFLNKFPTLRSLESSEFDPFDKELRIKIIKK